jgi:Domain of Unknown Function (DUF1080)
MLMYLRRTYLVSRFIILIIIIVFGLSECADNKTPSRKVLEPIQQAPDTSFLFDGKSLDGWEVTNFGPQGPVSISGSSIILGMGDGCTGITWKRAFPRTGYEVSLDAERIAGNDFFCGITFPAGKNPCSLIVGGWGGATVGLSSIDGRDAAENETTTIRNFESNRWYSIRLRVTADSIKSWIDDIKVVDFFIDSKKISIRPEVELSRPFGITSWNTTAALRNIRMRRIEK